jgi:hypothetical protein
LVVFNGLTLPHITKIQEQRTRTLYDVPIPNREFGYRKDLGGVGSGFTVHGWIQSADSVARPQISALAGTTGILDLQEPWPQPFDAVLYCQQTTSGGAYVATFTNDTGPAYVPGSPFTVLAAATDLMYFGFHQRWNLMQFIFWVFGSYGTIYWEYSQGTGFWNLLAGYTDGTNGLTQNGALTFTPPSDWTIDTVNGFGNLFWLRVGALSVTTAATLNQLLLNPCYQCLLQNPLYVMDPTVYDYTDYELTFDQVENPSIPSLANAQFDPLGFDSGYHH